MLIFKVFLIFVEVVCSFLLITVVLLQKAKGEGLGLAFGAQMGESLFGARAGNVLVKITVWLGVIFMVTTTLLARIYVQGRSRPLMERPAPIERKAMPVQPQAPLSAPLPDSQPVSALPLSSFPAVPPAPQAGE